VTTDIDEQTRLGELYMAALVRAQWRLSVSVLTSATVMVGGLPLLFLFVPATLTLRVGPIPLPWLILGVLLYPALWLVARYYVRQSEQIERDFTELVRRR
jgi:positive regulator of sigma E activity